MSQHSTKSTSTIDTANLGTIDDVHQNDVLHTGFFIIHTSCDSLPISTHVEPYQHPKSSLHLLGDALNSIMLLQDRSSHRTHAITTIGIFNVLQRKTTIYLGLQDYVLVDKKYVRGKQDALIAYGVPTMQAIPTPLAFLERTSDNSLK